MQQQIQKRRRCRLHSAIPFAKKREKGPIKHAQCLMSSALPALLLLLLLLLPLLQGKCNEQGQHVLLLPLTGKALTRW